MCPETGENWQSFEKDKSTKNLAEAFELRNMRTRAEIARKLEKNLPRLDFFTHSINAMVAELHENGQLKNDAGLFSQQEMRMIVADEDGDTVERMVVFALRESIRKQPDRDWVDYLVKNKPQLIENFINFAVRFNWSSGNNEYGTVAKIVAEYLRLNYKGELGAHVHMFGKTRVVIYEPDLPQLGPIVMLHELQHVADSWLETTKIPAKNRLKERVLWSLYSYFSKEQQGLRWVLLAYPTAKILYESLTGTRVLIATELTTSIATALLLELLVILVRDKVGEKWFESYWEDSEEKSARDFSENSTLVRENLPQPIGTKS